MTKNNLYTLFVFRKHGILLFRHYLRIVYGGCMTRGFDGIRMGQKLVYMWQKKFWAYKHFLGEKVILHPKLI